MIADKLRNLGLESNLPFYNVFRKSNETKLLSVNIAKVLPRNQVCEDGYSSSLIIQLNFIDLESKTNIVRNFLKEESLIKATKEYLF